MGIEDATLMTTMIGTLISFLGFMWVKVLRPAVKFMDSHEEVVKSIDTIKFFANIIKE